MCDLIYFIENNMLYLLENATRIPAIEKNALLVSIFLDCVFHCDFEEYMIFASRLFPTFDMARKLEMLRNLHILYVSSVQALITFEKFANKDYFFDDHYCEDDASLS